MTDCRVIMVLFNFKKLSTDECCCVAQQNCLLKRKVNLNCALFKICMKHTSTDTGQGAISHCVAIGRQPTKQP
jgi:hypothetical protein